MFSLVGLIRDERHSNLSVSAFKAQYYLNNWIRTDIMINNLKINTENDFMSQGIGPLKGRNI